MEVALMRANVLESHKPTMTQFLHGLNREIHDMLKFYHCTSLDNLVHLASRVESQQKRCLALKRSNPSSFDSWKGNDEERERPKQDKSPKKGSILTHGRKEETTPPNSNTLPPNAPNERNMVVREDGIVENESSREESSFSSEVESSSDSSHDEGYLLMVRRLMNVQVNGDSDSQRENIFHCRCHVEEKLCPCMHLHLERVVGKTLCNFSFLN
ncbi:hypothetical protein CR513_61268, partial [Mucuna pruriens]